MMTTPALALFYGGMSRSKSVLNMMMMSFISIGVVGIVYVLWGWSMALRRAATARSSPTRSTMFGLEGVATSDYIFVVFQLTFAVITAALISGAVADRVKFSAWVVFLPSGLTLSTSRSPTWCGAACTDVRPLISQRSTIGAQDYAGGTAVHINAGVAGLVLALILGKRLGFGKEPMRPHNLTLTMLGAGLLWFGWYGFNVGSIVFATTVDEPGGVPPQFTPRPAWSSLNTTLATCAAILGWLLVEKIRDGKATSLGAASGIVAGLVAITPACGARRHRRRDRPSASSPACACALAVGLKFRFGYDDSLDVVGVHLVGGLVGTVLIGLFSTSAGAGGVDGLFYGGGFALLGGRRSVALVAIALVRRADAGHRARDQVHARVAGRARTTRSRASTSPSTVRRPTTCTPGRRRR